MISQIALLCLVSLAAAQYRPQYEAPAYPQHYEKSYEAKPEPYSFGYDVKDEYGATQSRKEEGDEYGYKKGSYSYTDGYGIYREVEYVADDKGFRAVVKTNEPGTDNQNPADVLIHSEAAPVKYEGPSNYGKAPAYSKPAGPSYDRPAPVYRSAPSAHASAPVYQQAPQPQAYSPPSYQHQAPKPYHPAAPAYQAPHPAPANNYSPY